MAYGGFGGFGGGNMQGLLRQAQKMQEDMARARKELDETQFVGSSGGGMVTVVMMGNKTLASLKIKEEVVDPEDTEMLEDLIVSAFNDAMAQIAKAEKEKLPQIPGM